MDPNYEADELLQHIANGGYIEEGSKEHGIARQCNDLGYDSLSPAQAAVYNRGVLPHLAKLQAKKDVEETKRGMPD